MENKIIVPPSLPVYEKPKDFKKADIPESVAKAPKPHGIMNKMMSRMLKMKTKMPKTPKKPIKKMKKKRII